MAGRSNARQRTRETLGAVLVGLIVIGVGTVVVHQVDGSSCDPPVGMMAVPTPETVVDPAIRDTAPPWPADPSTLESRLVAAGITPLTERVPSGSTVREAHVDVFVNGAPVVLPAGIGTGRGSFAPIQTGDASGVVRMIGPGNFPLRELFAVWGVQFTANSIGNLCNHGGDVLQVWVNGRHTVGDLLNVSLLQDGDHGEVVIAFGNSSEVPSPMPTSYAFIHPRPRPTAAFS